MAHKLDDTDERLISLLTRNARTPVATLAREVGLSRPAVHERLQRLERDGVIQGYTVIAPVAGRRGLRVHVLVCLEPKVQDRVIDILSGIPALKRLFTVSGEYDLVLELAIEDAEELDRLLTKIGKVQGVTKTITLVNLSKRVDRGD